MGALDEEILSTQIYEGENNNLSEEMPEIVPRPTDTHQGNNKEVELTEKEIILRCPNFH